MYVVKNYKTYSWDWIGLYRVCDVVVVVYLCCFCCRGRCLNFRHDNQPFFLKIVLCLDTAFEGTI